MTGCRFCFQLVKMSEPYSVVFLPNYGVCLSSPISLISHKQLLHGDCSLYSRNAAVFPTCCKI